MAKKLRIATFNMENLFARFDFGTFFKGEESREAKYLAPIVRFFGDFGDSDLTGFDDFRNLVRAASISQEDDKRQQTALAIARAKADVVALQEVDDFRALERFLAAYYAKLGETAYRHLVVHEGNDRRGIDLAVMSHADWPLYTRSHADITPAWLDDTQSGRKLLDTFKKAAKEAEDLSRKRIFRRDCLEVVTAKPELTIFNCHFKSMSGGRDDTIGMRQLEAITVREIINRKFEDPSRKLWCVVGDLNDYGQVIKVSKRVDDDGRNLETIVEPDESGIDPLLADDFGFNLVDALPEAERWTHFYPAERHKTQLDYIIASPALAEKSVGVPEIIRLGMPYRVPNSGGIERVPRIGWDRPKASDHCPVVAEFSLDSE